MVVQASKEYSFMVAFLFLVIVAFFCILASMGNNLLFPCIVIALLLFIEFRFWVAVGRTLTFDENGCTVSFLFLKKHYSWTELRTKRILNYQNAIGYRDTYEEGVIFSSKKIKTPLKQKPAQYSFLLHPFCFFFVNFTPTTPYSKWVNIMRGLYEVDKDTFLEKFSQYLES